jgi:hypothetical protein
LLLTTQSLGFWDRSASAARKQHDTLCEYSVVVPSHGRICGGPQADRRMGAMVGRGGSGGPRMVRGSVVTHRRRCGKPNCHCAAGEALHEETVFTYSERSRTRSVTLSASEVAGVRAAVERYRSALAKLEAAGETGRDELLARLAGRRGRR